MDYKLFVVVLLMTVKLRTLRGDGITINNLIRFPYGDPAQGPFIGIFLAIALPLDLPEYNIFVSYNIEANYNLPSNETDFTYPPVISKRSLGRKYIYDVIENRINTYGYPGKKCLLRTICEAAAHAMEQNGVLVDVVNIILSPSSSALVDVLPTEYAKAEEYGKSKKNCRKYRKMCSLSLLSLITQDFFV